MKKKIIIDPITRIEGHLKVEVEVEKGKVVKAHSSGTMARGFEILLEGKDPRDAQQITQRVCGVCPASHSLASSQCLDMAFGTVVPDNARIIRNLIAGSNYLQSHILHFYHLNALDYLDILAIANYKGLDPKLNEIKRKVIGLVKSGDTYPLTPRFEPDEFTISDPEIVTMAVAHYLEALEMRKTAHVMLAIFGGKMPMSTTMVPGGVTIHPTVDMIAKFLSYLRSLIKFVNEIYLKDVVTLGTGPLLSLGQLGVGKSCGNFLSYGMFDLGKSGDYTNRFLPSGVIMNNEIKKVQALDPLKITEAVRYSWYAKECGKKHPAQGKTEYQIDKKNAYSFLKAPRYNGQVMEAGPLARLLVKGDKTLLNLAMKYQIQLGALARIAARAIECKLVAEEMEKWLYELVTNIKSGKKDICNEKSVPNNSQGMGLVEAPRGALGHWIEIEKKRIKNYQLVVPTTWNASPRDEKNQPGPLEQALVGVPLPDPENPINVIRVVHSFDPCLACAIHLIHPKNNKVLKFSLSHSYDHSHK